MSLLLFLLFGLLIGFIARALMPGKQSMGFLATALVGVVGSLVGGVATSLVTGEGFDGIEPAGIIGSILGALAVLAVYGWYIKRRATVHGPRGETVRRPVRTY